MALTKVTGHVIKSDTNITSHNINSSGIITAISFDGNVSGVAVTFTGDSTIGSLGITTNLTVGGISTFTGNIDVDGHTDLDNVSISGVTTASDNVIIPDNKKLILGSLSGRQLHLYHNTSGSSNHVIESTSSSNHLIFKATTINPRSDYFSFRNYAHNQNVFTIDADGQTKLFFNGNTKFETTNTGAVVSGILTVTGNMNVEGVLTYQDVTNIDSIGIVTARAGIVAQDDVTFQTANGNNIYIDKSENSLKLGDSTYAKFGGAGELMMYHDGTYSVIKDTNSSPFNFEATGTITFAKAGLTETYAKMIPDGAVELYYNGTKKFETGNTVNINSNHFEITSGQQLRFDNSNNNRTSEILNDGSSGNSVLTFKTNGGNRWTIDSSGHLLPGAVGSYNIGSTGAEIGTVYLADNKLLYLGSDQDLSISHNGTHGYIHAATGGLYMKVGNGEFLNRSGSQVIAKFLEGTGGVELWYNNVKKFDTVEKGIEVTGEVAATQDYPNIRPVLDFNFAATKKLKPEMTFERAGEASFHDGVGSVKFVSDNEPRFEHDILTGECKGLMFEQTGTNYSWHSRQFYSSGYPSGSWVPQNGGATPTITENTHTAPDGTSDGYYMADTISGATGTVFNGNVVKQEHTAGANVKHTFSIYIKLITATQATIYIRDGATGSTSSANAVNTKTWQRVYVTSSAALTNSTSHAFYIGNTNGTIAVWGSQIERSNYVSSYIKTVGGANGTRNPDKGVRLDGEDVADVFNDGKGTLIAEAILTKLQSNNPIVGFYENFTDDNRVELRGDASSVGGARFEAVVNDSSVVSLTTGLTHSGVNNVSKYAYAFEVNNYAGCVNGGSVTTDTNGAFPSGMDSMMIGEAVYAVDGAVIVKRIMYYADRLPNSQLVTLTS